MTIGAHHLRRYDPGAGRISQLTNEHREGWEARVCGRYRGTEVANVAAMAGSGKAFYIVILVFVFVEICRGWAFPVDAVEITLDFNSCFQ